MPRKRREASPTGIYHWIVRGMNKRRLFHEREDYGCFFDLVYEYAREEGIEVYHYCLMTNHAHFLLKTMELKHLSRFAHYVQRRYAYSYCKKYKKCGSVFQRGYRSFCVDKDSYLLECGRYIERNPVRAKIVGHPGDYLYTSYRFYAQGEKNDLLTASPAYLGLSPLPVKRESMYDDYVCRVRIQDEMIERGLLARLMI